MSPRLPRDRAVVRSLGAAWLLAGFTAAAAVALPLGEGALSHPGPSPHDEAASAGSLFEDVTEEVGLATPVTVTWGAAWSDADGDGRVDLYLGRHDREAPTLFLNRGDGFLAVHGLVEERFLDRHGPAFADFDGDGDQDLFVTTGGGVGGTSGLDAELYRQGPGGTAEEVAAELGVAHTHCRGRGAAWIDHDGDRDLDLLYVCANEDVGARTVLFENRGPEGFTPDEAFPSLEEDFNGGVFPADYDDDGDVDLLLTAATRTRLDRSLLLRNDGGRFTDVTEEVGIGPLHNGRGAAWFDCEGDGDLDLYIGRGANFRGNGPDGWTLDPARPSEVGWHHKVRGGADLVDLVILRTEAPEATFSFPEVPPFVEPPPLERIFLGPNRTNPAVRPFTLPAGHPAFEGRPDVDPREAEAGVYIWHEEGAWFVASAGGGGFFQAAGLVRATGPFTAVTGEFLESPGEDRSNRLYRNDGGVFTDITAAAGVGSPWNTGPVVAGDFDNDGDVDLIGLNGDHVHPVPNPWLAYRNDGACRFTDVSGLLGLPRRPLSRKATAVSADYDDDGDLDLWVSNELGPAPYQTGPYHLLRNRGTGNRGLTIRLVGTRSNRDALGARVRVEAGGRTQIREATGGYSLYSQNDPRLHFGLGREERAERITIRWPSGQTQVIEDVPAGGAVTIVEP